MPHGFDTARNHKNNLKYRNNNKVDGGKEYFSGMCLTSNQHDHTKHGQIRNRDKHIRNERDIKTSYLNY